MYIAIGIERNKQEMMLLSLCEEDEITNIVNKYNGKYTDIGIVSMNKPEYILGFFKEVGMNREDAVLCFDYIRKSLTETIHAEGKS